MRKIKTSKKLAVSAFALAASATLLFPGNVFATPVLNEHFKEDTATGTYKYYTDANKTEVNTTFTGVAWVFDDDTNGTVGESDLDELRYFKNGISVKDYTGLVPYTGAAGTTLAGTKFVYFKDGEVATTFNGIQEYDGVQYLVIGGEVNATTLANNSIYVNTTTTKGTWKIKAGKVDTAFSGLVATKSDSKDGTIADNITTDTADAKLVYKIKDGVLDKTEGFAGDAKVFATTDDDAYLYYFVDGTAINEDHALNNSVRRLGDDKNTWVYMSSDVTPAITINSKKLVTIDYTYTGLAANKKNNTFWIVKKGIVDFNYSGVAANQLDGGAAAITNEWKVDKDLTNPLDANDFVKITNGQVDKSFTGFVDYKADPTTVKSVKVYFNDGLTGDPLADRKDAYDTGAVRPLGDKNNTWLYVKNDAAASLTVADATYTGLAPNPNNFTYWYAEEGKVNFGFSGNVGNNSVVPDYGAAADVFVLNGQVYISTFTGFVKTAVEVPGFDILVDKYFYLVEGEVKAYPNGAVRPLGDVANTWYYVNDEGIVDFAYTGVASNPNTKISWYVKNGVVDFSYTGEYQAANNVTYTIINGKVTSVSIK